MWLPLILPPPITWSASLRQLPGLTLSLSLSLYLSPSPSLSFPPSLSISPSPSLYLFSTVVECLREPLQLENGRPGTETEEGVWTEVTPDQRLGFDTTVTFRCNEGFSLSNRELNRTCQLNGTWSKSTPTCNSESCVCVCVCVCVVLASCEVAGDDTVGIHCSQVITLGSICIHGNQFLLYS